MHLFLFVLCNSFPHHNFVTCCGIPHQNYVLCCGVPHHDFIHGMFDLCMLGSWFLLKSAGHSLIRQVMFHIWSFSSSAVVFLCTILLTVYCDSTDGVLRFYFFSVYVETGLVFRFEPHKSSTTAAGIDCSSGQLLASDLVPSLLWCSSAWCRVNAGIVRVWCVSSVWF